MQFPEKFETRMKTMLGSEYEAFAASFDKPFHNAMRANVLKISADTLKEKMHLDGARVPWNPNGFYIEDKKYFTSHPYYHAGLYYVQEASAMLPAAAADAQPGEKILDLCAAPGGKSTAMAAAMQGSGILISNDISHSRAKALLRNIEGAGVTNCIVMSEDPAKLSRRLPDYFDKILIDAPCSGEGMFHKEPAMMTAWEKSGPAFYSKLQRQILENAVGMLRPGGILIYSTCTVSPDEDERCIAWLLDTHPEFELLPLEDGAESRFAMIAPGRPEWADGREALRLTGRIWPHLLEGEGHFTARLRKKADAAVQAAPSHKEKKKKNTPSAHKGDLEHFYDFLDKADITRPFDRKRLVVSNGYVRYVPQDAPDLSGLYTMRCGWFLGEIRKGRFEPSGAFARGLEAGDCGKVTELPSDSQEVRKYLKCETLPCESSRKGWQLVTTDGYALGWAKAAGGMLRNKYPAGWRIMS